MYANIRLLILGTLMLFSGAVGSQLLARSLFPVEHMSHSHLAKQLAIDVPSILSYHGDPNGVVTASRGSICLDASSNDIWVNENSYRAWSRLSTAAKPTNSNVVGDSWVSEDSAVYSGSIHSTSLTTSPTSCADGQTLMWDSWAEKWTCSMLTTSGITYVNTGLFVGSGTVDSPLSITSSGATSLINVNSGGDSRAIIEWRGWP